ncbi:MAG: PD40 domain-containing protein [Anaerolineales bacterium]|nr:PD40 domain-containing protein [Anaerolineales bacterium]
MRALPQKLLALGIILTVLVSSLGRVEAAPGKGKWGFGDARYIAIQRICHDGLEFSAVRNPADQLIAQSVNVAVRLFTATGLPFPDPTDSNTKRPFDSYGPLLIATTFYSMTIHAANDTYPADVNNNSILEASENFRVYVDDAQILWSRHLPTNERIVMLAGAGVLSSDVVEDCYLNQMNVDEGAALTIDNAHLNATLGLSQPGPAPAIVTGQPQGLLPPADLVYRVTSLPTNGILRRNGVALNVNDTFTQSDVNSNLLTYTHDGSDTTSDAFGYTVAATTRVSVSSSEVQATGGTGSSNAAIAGSGAYVVYQSTATNLVASDTNTVSDIFARNLAAGTTERLSRNFGGVQGNGGSFNPAISAFGEVVFESDATNLVTGTVSASCTQRADTNGVRDIFRTSIGATYNAMLRVSVQESGGCQEANNDSFVPAITLDGFSGTVFASEATNLVTSSQTDDNADRDIFTQAGATTVRQSLINGTSSFAAGTSGQSSGGDSNAPSIANVSSGPSSFIIAFQSAADDLVAGDTFTYTDVFVRDNASSGASNKTVRVSVSTGGAQANGSSTAPSISADGRYVAFQSAATNLIASDTNNTTDIFVRDRDTEADGTLDEGGAVSTTRISLANGGIQADGGSVTPFISAYGRFVAFHSIASNLVAGDTNACVFIINYNCNDVFVYDRQTNTIVRASVSSSGAQANEDSFNATLSADGDFVAFQSEATNLVSGDSNDLSDVFVRYLGYSSTFTIAINPIADVFPVFLPLVQK